MLGGLALLPDPTSVERIYSRLHYTPVSQSAPLFVPWDDPHVIIDANALVSAGQSRIASWVDPWDGVLTNAHYIGQHFAWDIASAPWMSLLRSAEETRPFHLMLGHAVAYSPVWLAAFRTEFEGWRSPTVRFQSMGLYILNPDGTTSISREQPLATS